MSELYCIRCKSKQCCTFSGSGLSKNNRNMHKFKCNRCGCGVVKFIKNVAKKVGNTVKTIANHPYTKRVMRNIYDDVIVPATDTFVKESTRAIKKHGTDFRGLKKTMKEEVVPWTIADAKHGITYRVLIE